MNDAIDILNDAFCDTCYDINIICFADDVLLFAESPEEMETKINLFKQSVKSFGLEINQNKSSILSIKETNVNEIMNIQMNKETKYLGVNLSTKPSLMKNHFHNKIVKSEKFKFSANQLLIGKRCKVYLGKIIWKNAVLPSILHGSAATVIPTADLKALDLELIEGDLSQAEDVNRAATGVDVICHLGAAFQGGGPQSG